MNDAEPSHLRLGAPSAPPGRIKVRDFLDGLARTTRELLPPELRGFEHRLQGSLVKLDYGDRSQHYEVWVRRSAGLVELGLHFESRDRERNARLLDWFADEIGIIKAQLGERVEAEVWDRGWTRVHQVIPLETLDEPFQRRLADHLARAIELLEPLRRDAAEALSPGPIDPPPAR